MIIEQIPVGRMAVFCYLIAEREGGDAILIDPASDFDKISEYITRYKLKLKKIVNTHGHFDHTSGNSYFCKMTGAGLMIHEYDYGFLKTKINRFASFIKGGRCRNTDVTLLRDNDTFTLGGLILKVIHTPGHTRGSICILCEDNLFTGDTLFTEGRGRTDFPGSSEPDMIESIKSRILTLPDDTKIWPGHHYGRFPVSTVGEQKKYYFG